DPVPLGPFPDNAPPYLGYRLLDQPGEALELALLRALPTQDVHTLLIGSDGVGDLVMACEATLPGGRERVGPIDQFFRKDVYFRNPDAVRRRLALLNRPSIRPDWDRRTVSRD